MNSLKTGFCCIALTLLSSVCEAQQQAASIAFRIEPRSMKTALTQFGQQAGLQIMFSKEAVTDLKSPGVVGSYTPEAALQQLIANSGLHYEFVNARTIRIWNAADVKNGGAGAIKLNVETSQASMLRLAQLDAAVAGDAEIAGEMVGDPNGGDAAKKRVKSKDGVEEMIVEEGRIKPFSGSNADIPRTINDPQPYYIFDSETIERSAALNVEDFLKQRLTMNTTIQTGSQPSSAGAGGNNISQINLRGLGISKTLVLVNGRRVAGPPGNGGLTLENFVQADLNGYPLSAIERIEVLPSSASGIYGGGALGGVINVVLKQNFSGGEARVAYDNTWDVDTPNRQVGMTYGMGFNGGKTHLMLMGQWSDGSALLLKDRRSILDDNMATITRNSPTYFYSLTFPPAGSLPNISSTSEFLNGQTIPDPGVLTLKNGTSLGSRSTYVPAGISSTTSVADLRAALYANRGQYNLDLPDVGNIGEGLRHELTVTPTVKSFMMSVSHEFSERFRATLDWNHNENNSIYYSGFAPNYQMISSANPTNPFTSAVYVRFPVPLTSGVHTESMTDALTGSLKVSMPYDWVGQADLSLSRSERSNGWMDFDSTAYNNDLNAGLLNFFVDPNIASPDLAKYQGVDAKGHTTGLSSEFAFRGSGPLFALPWGKPALTVGAEHRVAKIEDAWFSRDFPITKISNYIRDLTSNKQTIDSLYAETLIPLIKRDWLPLVSALELQLSGRMERYQVNTGTPYKQTTLLTGVVTYGSPTLNGLPYISQAAYSTRSETVGLKYQPLKDLTLRVSRATAFVPPQPTWLLENPLPNTFLTTVTDPTKRQGDLGYSVPVQTISGGNPNLKPQNSESFNAGVIWEPSAEAMRGLRVNAEYYRIQQMDSIGSLSAQQIIDNAGLFPGRVVRNSVGFITFVDTSFTNLYRAETEGWDLSLDYRVKTAAGNFGFSAVESIILHMKSQYAFGQPEIEAVNFPSDGGAPKYKSNATLLWERNGLTASWAARYLGAYKQNGAAGGPRAQTGGITDNWTRPQGGDTIPAQIYHDVAVGYAFGRDGLSRKSVNGLWGDVLSGVTLQFGVKNLFNKVPPLDVNYPYYLSPFGDMRLRSYWLSLKKQF